MRDLPRRVDAGIGAAGAADRHVLAAKPLDRLLDRRLHGMLPGLPLPAGIGAAVIFDVEAVAGHGYRLRSASSRRRSQSYSFGELGAAQEFRRGQRLAAGALHFEEPDRASPQATVSSSSSSVPGIAVAGRRRPSAAPSAARPCRQSRLRTRRRGRATARGYGRARLGGPAASRCASRPCRSCWRRSRLPPIAEPGVSVPASSCASASTINRAPTCISRSCSSPPVMRAVDRDAFGQRDRAGVEPGIHLHDHHAGLAVAGHDGALDGRGAAPARQQRGVAVEGAEPRSLEDRDRQQQPVGHDDGGIGAEDRGRPAARPRPSARPACAPSMPSRSASRCTGDGVSSRPRRPAGRGGCV